MRRSHASVFGWALISLLLIPVPVWAGVTVIYDSGDTRPLTPYLEILERTEPATDDPPINTPRQGAADVQALLPIRSPGLSPGPVRARSHHRPFARPFFLIGSDSLSRQWLLQHRDRLKSIGAVGMLVQAETREDLQAIASLSRGLPIMPASAADIATALNLTHYPVLISTQAIEQ
ncbi:integrating conjugative element protein [Sedimenticola selenatireducens]|uniref:Integrating conjugative element protein n=1 Tax=Sedimenticola selenatireducens TaxID=191960 RepID=A0A2N6CW27_9GAMM|nr:integrating conjugative element protein [Sedimenticola selenatireducens]PLX61435.1 MAG: integrating conjugative element protein [Sedimenticola selenatireducens]